MITFIANHNGVEEPQDNTNPVALAKAHGLAGPQVAYVYNLPKEIVLLHNEKHSNTEKTHPSIKLHCDIACQFDLKKREGYKMVVNVSLIDIQRNEKQEVVLYKHIATRNSLAEMVGYMNQQEMTGRYRIIAYSRILQPTLSLYKDMNNVHYNLTNHSIDECHDMLAHHITAPKVMYAMNGEIMEDIHSYVDMTDLSEEIDDILFSYSAR